MASNYPQETSAATALLPGSLVHQRREAVAANTLLCQLDILKKTGRYDCFNLKWHPVYSRAPEVWPVPDHLFWDSDVAKWIEGACYLLHDHPHPKIDASIHELVGLIRSAQQPDGYLNLHYTMVEPGKRFTNLRDMHELYNAGHMIEAALAHQHLYKNDMLMDPILKYVDLLHKTFGPGEDQIHGYPGHPEIELALIRLYNRTQNPKHLELASYFIHERGNPTGVKGEHYYDVELRARGDDPYKRPSYHTEVGGCKWYYSAHKPIIEQETVEGHSVRAMYLLTAAADLTRVSSGKASNDLRKATYRLWNNMTQRKMYVTGGIGAVKQYEGFGRDFFLPQGTDEGGCYAETCASIGAMMLAQRILQYDLDSRYSDVMELCLYNAVLTVMSHDGTAFTYVNQLASSDADPAKRSDWFTVACCPPNTLRLLGSIGGYIYSDDSSNGTTSVNVHLYIPSKHTFNLEGQEYTLTQKSNYPWNGAITFTLDRSPETGLSLRLRIPSFAKAHWHLDPPLPSTPEIQKGYLHIPSSYLAALPNQSFTLSLPVTPRLITPHPYATNSNTLTLARGPIIYCVEDVDNPWVTDHFKSVRLDPACLDRVREEDVRDERTGDVYTGLTVVEGARVLDVERAEGEMMGMPFLEVGKSGREAGVNGVNGVNGTHSADFDGLKTKTIEELRFVPFYFRANRGGRGHSRVGIDRWDQC
ncbi:hypothetical protein LTR70_002165 [Exophiala xenobiotica]|uniref:DUF1680-domain-containing protein n=1 Tax=Lithohypha guttulata TaxID=1690604 RepID=A0ABR0K5D2_9EURO|nr:hypothetical protein LTR24_006787 [Lithohypha guttulata]KAK5326165.1 hypothetical protein LTR70_002165 [Exophiala xenobiotica]